MYHVWYLGPLASAGYVRTVFLKNILTCSIWLATSAASGLQTQKTQSNTFSYTFHPSPPSFLCPARSACLSAVCWGFRMEMNPGVVQGILTMQRGESGPLNWVNEILMWQDVEETSGSGPWNPIMTHPLYLETCCSRFFHLHQGAELITREPSAHTQSHYRDCAGVLSFPKNLLLESLLPHLNILSCPCMLHFSQ